MYKTNTFYILNQIIVIVVERTAITGEKLLNEYNDVIVENKIGKLYLTN